MFKKGKIYENLAKNVQNLKISLSARPGLGTQPRYEVPSNSCVKIITTLSLTLG